LLLALAAFTGTAGGEANTPTDYPSEALRLHQQGRVVTRLTISAAGKVTSCQVVQSTHSTALDGETCRIALTRARFSPARDKSGRAIASQAEFALRWELPPAE